MYQKMNNKVILNALLIIFLVLVNWSCTDNAGSDLRKRIKEYYKLEQESNWEKAYFFRTPSFQGGIPKEMYIEGMKKYMKGWTLHKYEIKEVSHKLQNSFAEVVIYFEEQHTSEGISIITQPTAWERINGVWYGRDVGNRQRLPLNSELVFERY
jgi:hypothetical protein